MKHNEEICDDEIRIIGNRKPEGNSRPPWMLVSGIVAVVLLVLVAAGIWIYKVHNSREIAEEGVYEPLPEPVPQPEQIVPLGRMNEVSQRGFIEQQDTVINDIPLRIFIPHNAEMTLHLGAMDYSDTTLVYVAQAADIRRDNGKIVGAFVLAGEPKAWGLSKKGYCAVIDGEVKVGVADNTPLFEEATERGGYFFRQYPLVDEGRLVENEPKNKSIRRALCDRNGEIFMVDCTSRESFHDFAQALVDLGVTNAIYLVGSNSFGMWEDNEGRRYTFGDQNFRWRFPRNTSYILWKKSRGVE